MSACMHKTLRSCIRSSKNQSLRPLQLIPTKEKYENLFDNEGCKKGIEKLLVEGISSYLGYRPLSCELFQTDRVLLTHFLILKGKKEVKWLHKGTTRNLPTGRRPPYLLAAVFHWCGFLYWFDCLSFFTRICLWNKRTPGSPKNRNTCIRGINSRNLYFAKEKRF